MKYTIEDVKRLVPESGLQDIVHLIVIVCGEKPGSRIEADLAYGLLDTRRQLEIAREALGCIQQRAPSTAVDLWYMSTAENAIEAINKEDES